LQNYLRIDEKGELPMKSKPIILIVAVAVIAVTIGCSSATPTDTPGVDRMGQYILRQYGPELWTVLAYKFANSQIGEEWMILEVGLTSPAGQVATVTREDVFLRTPGGDRISLPSQKQFNKAFGSLQSTISRANVNRDPLDYFPPDREECALQFFVTPGGGVSFDEVAVNQFRGCFGRLYINVPGGIQPGRWTFAIDQPESEIRIPFELGE
jgi:hypothetical protein